MRKKIIPALAVAAAVLAAVLGGCSEVLDAEAHASGGLNVVATIFPCYDFARAVMGGGDSVTMLVRPGADIHSFELSMADAVKINGADVFICIGGESEAWAETVLGAVSAEGVTAVRLMDHITAVYEELKEGMEGDGGEVGELDEHIWTSPLNAIVMVNAVADALCEADPPNAAFYRANAAAYTAELSELHGELKDAADRAELKKLIIAGRFPFRYLTDEYGLDYRAAFPGCSVESDVSASTLAYLIDEVRNENIPYVFFLELENRSIADAITKQTGAGALPLHSCQNVSGGEFDSGATYLSLMRINAENLRKGLTAK